MESKLDLIVLQNWALIGLLIVLVAMSAYCGYHNLKNMRRSEDRHDSRLGELWDEDKVEELEKLAIEILEKYPNHIDALYFLGKVLAKKGESEEAIKQWKKVQEIEPGLHISMKNLIEATRHRDDT